MSLALGKRKRRQEVDKKPNVAAEESDDDAAARALFQRAFEKKFKPLDPSENPKEERKPAVRDDSEDDDLDEDEDEDEDDSESGSENDDEDEDDFSGFSGSEDNEEAPSKPQIEVIEDRTFRRANPAEEKLLKRQFMSSKIPSATPQYPIPKKSSAANATDIAPKDDEDKDNLQNDLALQRLLKESHLLDANTFSASGSASSAPEGAARLRALDMRIRDLGGKKSHLDQDRMPIAFRKGMVAKASEREDKRRTEAKENGIILERFAAKGASRGGAGAATRGGGRERKREIGTGGPDIGTYRGATLRLSKNDIKGMESSKRGGKGGRGGRGGKKKGPMKFGSGF